MSPRKAEGPLGTVDPRAPGEEIPPEDLQEVRAAVLMEEQVRNRLSIRHGWNCQARQRISAEMLTLITTEPIVTTLISMTRASICRIGRRIL